MPVGSLTKAFTATAIGELVAEGKMDWDTTPVNTYLPEFELKDPVVTSQLTLVDILSHRTVSLFVPCLLNLLDKRKFAGTWNMQLTIHIFYFFFFFPFSSPLFAIEYFKHALPNCKDEEEQG